MKMLLVGALGMLALQVVLLGGYLVVDSQDPILLDPESGSLEEDGLTMVMLCGGGHIPEGRGSEVLSKMPPMETSAGGSGGGLCGATPATSGTTTMSFTTRTPTKSA